MKLSIYLKKKNPTESRPVRGAWIETSGTSSPRDQPSRAPHGARGLKQQPFCHRLRLYLSRPARGAWIETRKTCSKSIKWEVAPRTGRVD